MPKQKSWAMSAIVVGPYLCAIYGARGTSVVAKSPVRADVPRPASVRTRPAAGAVTVCDADR